MLIIVAVFIYVAMNAGNQTEYEPVQKRFYSIRSVLFWVLVATFSLVSFITFPQMPYAAQRSDTSEAQRIDVKGFQ
jgi:hypothetical protein